MTIIVRRVLTPHIIRRLVGLWGIGKKYNDVVLNRTDPKKDKIYLV